MQYYYCYKILNTRLVFIRAVLGLKFLFVILKYQKIRFCEISLGRSCEISPRSTANFLLFLEADKTVAFRPTTA